MYAAIGLAIHGEEILPGDFAEEGSLVGWLSALSETTFTVGSTALAAALIREARAVYRLGAIEGYSNLDVRSSVLVEVIWRSAIGVLLIIQLALKYAMNRKYFEPPTLELGLVEHPLTAYVWPLLLIVAIGDAWCRYAAQPVIISLWRRRVANVVGWVGVMLFGLYTVVEKNFITYLVHVACSGVDIAAEHSVGRYWHLNQEQERLLLLASVVAASAVIGAAMLSVRSLSRRGTHPLMALSGGGALLTGAASYCYWYYRIGLPKLSPDIAEAGIAANWFDQLGGIVLAATLSGVLIVRLQRGATTDATPLMLPISPAGASIPLLTCLVIASSFRAFYTIYVALDDSWTAGSMGAGEMLAYHILVFPGFILTMAIALLSSRLLWVRLQGADSHALCIHPTSRTRLIAISLVSVVLMAVAVPTLAAFSFLFWLGPWYRW